MPKLSIRTLMLAVLVLALYLGGIRTLIVSPPGLAQALAACGLSVLTAILGAAVKVAVRPELRRRWAGWWRAR